MLSGTRNYVLSGTILTLSSILCSVLTRTVVFELSDSLIADYFRINQIILDSILVVTYFQFATYKTRPTSSGKETIKVILKYGFQYVRD